MVEEVEAYQSAAAVAEVQGLNQNRSCSCGGIGTETESNLAVNTKRHCFVICLESVGEM